MSKILLAALACAVLLSCGGNGDNEPLHEQLTGTWTSDLMTVTFDWENNVYSGVALGEPFGGTLTLVSEEGNVVKFRSEENLVIVQIMDDGKILLRKDIEGAIPLIFERVE